MRIWAEHCLSYYYHDDVKVGLNWYKHSPHHKWKGFTFQIFFFKWMLIFNYVNDWAAYDRKINRKANR